MIDMQYEIRKNVPIPKPCLKGRSTGATAGVYPWKELEVGDCFIADVPPKRMSSAVAHRNRNTRYEYVRRTIDNKQWVWRIK